MKRYRIRLWLFILLFMALGCTWSYFRGLPFGNISPWAALPPDLPAMVTYPDYRHGWNAEKGIVAPEIAFSTSAQTDATLLGRVLKMWHEEFDLSHPISMTIGLHPAGNGQTALSMILDNSNRRPTLQKLLLHPQISRVVSSAYRGQLIYSVYLKSGESFAVTARRNLLVLARLPLWVEEAAGRLNWRPAGLQANEGFKKMLPPTDNPEKQPRKYLFVQTAFLSELLDGVFHQEGLKALENDLSLMDWIRLDFFLKPEGWALQGLGQSKLAHLFQSKKQVVKTAHLEVIPDHITMLFLGNTTHWNQMTAKAEKNLLRKYITPWAGQEFAVVLGHSRGIGLPADWFGLISMRNAPLAEQKLTELSAKKGLLDDYEYQTFRVRQIMTDDLLPFFPSDRMKNPYFTFLGDFAVFASSRAALEVWIDGFITGKTLAHDESFLPLYPHSKQQGEWFVYLPQKQLHNLLRHYELQSPAAEVLANLAGTIALRGNHKGEAFELSGAGHTGARDLRIQPSISWKVLLDAPAASPPFPVRDHQSGQTFVVVQDSLHRLYLLGPTGDIKWSRTLDDLLLSEVKPLDYYLDGSTTLLFNTAHQIYVLNLQGEDIGSFPLPLQSPATTGVTLAKFEGGHQHAFFIPCANGNIYGFDRLGTPLPGWNPLSGVGTMRFPLLYFQDAERDFLVALSERGEAKVLKRDASERFPAKIMEGIFLSPPDYQLSAQSNRIVAVNTSGMAHVIGLDGSSFRLACAVGAGRAARFAFGQLAGDERKDYAVLEGRTLVLYGYQKSDRFVKLFEHRLDSAQDDIFTLRLPGESVDRIGTYSRQAGKIYLLDGSGSLAPGFPLAGTSRFYPADLLKNGTPVLVAAYGDSVYAYQLQ